MSIDHNHSTVQKYDIRRRGINYLFYLWFWICVAGSLFHLERDDSCQWAMPWCKITNFVVSSDGLVFVRDEGYKRVICYDQQGKVRYTCKVIGRGSIAIDDRDRLFADVHDLFEFNLEGKLLSVTSMPNSTPGRASTWRINAAGKPEAIEREDYEESHLAGTVLKNQDLFVRKGKPTSFVRADGVQYRLSWWSIQQQNNDGTWRTIVTVPYACFPWCGYPILTSWFAICLRWIYLELMEKRNKRALL